MKYNRFLIIPALLAFIFILSPVMATVPSHDTPSVTSGMETVSPVLDNNTTSQESALYTVLAVVMVIWLGIAAYVFYLHITISRLEKKFDES
ncbi:MAG: CcmD family protein [Spirochaetota bacterium]